MENNTPDFEKIMQRVAELLKNDLEKLLVERDDTAITEKYDNYHCGYNDAIKEIRELLGMHLKNNDNNAVITP